MTEKNSFHTITEIYEALDVKEGRRTSRENVEDVLRAITRLSAPNVGWRVVRDLNEWVQMRSGAGESGWWHRHTDDPAGFGGNPVDDNKCRTCGKMKP